MGIFSYSNFFSNFWKSFFANYNSRKNYIQNNLFSTDGKLQPIFPNMPRMNIGWTVGDNFQVTTKKSQPYISLGRKIELNLTQKHQQELSFIKDIFNKNRAKYEKVEKATGVPAELICAIHYRESGCKFNTYLHNGDPLGKPTVHVPKGKFFTDWTSAAIDALKSGHYGNVSMSNINSQLTFAERYNGLGYKKRGLASPYVYSGTNQYTRGMYVADGKFNPDKKDTRVGVAAILDSLYKV